MSAAAYIPWGHVAVPTITGILLIVIAALNWDISLPPKHLDNTVRSADNLVGQGRTYCIYMPKLDSQTASLNTIRASAVLGYTLRLTAFLIGLILLFWGVFCWIVLIRAAPASI